MEERARMREVVREILRGGGKAEHFEVPPGCAQEFTDLLPERGGGQSNEVDAVEPLAKARARFGPHRGATRSLCRK